MVVSIIGGIIINNIGLYYKTIAEYSTRLENHKNYSTMENSLIIKRFAFEFFNNFLSLFYIAFHLYDLKALRKELVSVFLC